MAIKKKKEQETIIKEIIIVKKTSYKAAIITAVIALFVIGLIYSNMSDEKNTSLSTENETAPSGNIDKYVTAISSDKYLKMLKDEEVHIVYLASPNCSYCVKFEPTLTKVIDKYDLTVNYINTDIRSNDIGAIVNSSPKLADFGTPTLVITENGKVKDVNIGYVEEAMLIKFLIDNKIIKE